MLKLTVKYLFFGAVNSDGYELEVLLQKSRNKKSAIRFLTRLLGNYLVPRVIVTDKLRSYVKYVNMCPQTDYRSHKGLIIMLKMCINPRGAKRKY